MGGGRAFDGDFSKPWRESMRATGYGGFAIGRARGWGKIWLVRGTLASTLGGHFVCV